ncbi:hypothetical protein BCR34DRAFT_607352 [Clohesyomyces aquaticus]|uniref:Uncharacterized protein n=1 Tax=Clohesyomyces aquaticus TaxID=1231657 RepID=A0A1Y1YGV1_9PLEO|nr:hypothetical protein BCR34DRAFT_607352 [Clohesyomyces aquaticus]
MESLKDIQRPQAAQETLNRNDHLISLQALAVEQKKRKSALISDDEALRIGDPMKLEKPKKKAKFDKPAVPSKPKGTKPMRTIKSTATQGPSHYEKNGLKVPLYGENGKPKKPRMARTILQKWSKSANLKCIEEYVGLAKKQEMQDKTGLQIAECIAAMEEEALGVPAKKQAAAIQETSTTDQQPANPALQTPDSIGTTLSLPFQNGTKKKQQRKTLKPKSVAARSLPSPKSGDGTANSRPLTLHPEPMARESPMKQDASPQMPSTLKSQRSGASWDLGKEVPTGLMLDSPERTVPEPMEIDETETALPDLTPAASPTPTPVASPTRTTVKYLPRTPVKSSRPTPAASPKSTPVTTPKPTPVASPEPAPATQERWEKRFPQFNKSCPNRLMVRPDVKIDSYEFQTKNWSPKRERPRWIKEFLKPGKHGFDHEKGRWSHQGDPSLLTGYGHQVNREDQERLDWDPSYQEEFLEKYPGMRFRRTSAEIWPCGCQMEWDEDWSEDES